jgi:hypothetical protein
MKCKLETFRVNALSTSHSNGKGVGNEKSLPLSQQSNSQRKISFIDCLMMPSYQRNFLKLDYKLTALSKNGGGEVFEFLIRELHIAYQRFELKVSEDSNALKDLNSIFKRLRNDLKILNGILKCLIVDEDTKAKKILLDKYDSWLLSIKQKPTNSYEMTLHSDAKSNEFKGLVPDELRDTYLIYERRILFDKLGMATI